MVDGEKIMMGSESIIVSGITGFVGQNLKEYLENSNYEVKGVSRSSDYFSYEDCDELMDSAKAFVHLAGKAHDLKKTSEDQEYFDVNTDLTKRVYDQFLASKCEVFIFLSSVKAAADRVDGMLTEGIDPNPQTVYGQSKKLAEDYILNNIPSDKSVYILRPCMIHGPGNKGNLNLLYQFVAKGVPFPLASFENKRSFLSIDNLCFVINKLIEQRPSSGVYNVADDRSISTNELVTIIAKGLNKKSKLWAIPKGVIMSVARIGDRLSLPLNSERLQKLTESYVVSNAKIKQALSCSLPSDVETGLIKTIKSFSA